MMKKTLLFSAILMGLIACKNTPNKATDDNTFQNKDLGWQMEIPKDWTVAYKADATTTAQPSDKDMAAQSSYKPIDETAPQNNVTYLLNFKKDDKNSFTAFTEPFDSSFANYDQQLRNTREMFYFTLQQQGLKLDTIWNKEMIQGKPFTTFEITATDKNGQQVFQHVYYNAVINNKMLSAIVRYNTPENKAMILEKWKNSNFQ